MNEISKEIYVTQKRLEVYIDVTCGTDLVPITLNVIDYEIPAETTATVYSIGKENKLKKQICTISENAISFTPQKGFFEVGSNLLQVRMTYQNKDLISFEIMVIGHKSIVSDDAEEVNNNHGLMQQLLSEIGVLSARLNEALKIPEGGTTADAALNDIKVGYDETVYGSPGEAVREQSRNATEYAKKTSASLQQSKATAIISTLKGEVLNTNSSAAIPPRNLKLFGKSTQVSTHGNQLFDIRKCRNLTGYGLTFAVDGEYLSIKGTGEINYMAYDVDCEISAGTTVYLYITEGDASNLTYYLRDSDGNLVCAISKDGSAIPSKDVGRFRIVCDTSTYNTKLKIMLTSKENANYEPYTGGMPSPNPDYPQEIKSVVNPVIHMRTGSVLNKLSNNQIEWLLNNYNLWHDEKHFVFFDTYGENGTNRLVICKFKEGEDNYVSTFVKENGETFTGMYQLGIEIYNNSQFIYCPNLNIIISGTAKTILVDSNETVGLPDNYHIATLPYTLYGIPVSSGGNYTDENGQQYVADYVDFERGKYVKKVMCSSLKEAVWNDGWNEPFHIDGTFIVYTEQFNDVVKRGDIDNICSHFIRLSESILTSEKTQCQNGQGAAFNIAFRVPTTLANSIAEWEQWVSDNNMQLLFPLKTPIETDLTEEDIAQYQALCMNYPNTTIVNDAGAYMEVEYVEDTELYLAGNYVPISEHNALASRVSALEQMALN